MEAMTGSGSASHRLPAPAFGSSPNLQALALDAAAEPSLEPRTFQEITVVSADQPKLLSRLSEVMVRCWLRLSRCQRAEVYACTFRTVPVGLRIQPPGIFLHVQDSCDEVVQIAGWWCTRGCIFCILAVCSHVFVNIPRIYAYYEFNTVVDVQGDLGLNICEAHAFNTSDRFSLDIFVVDGWKPDGSKESLEQALSSRFAQVAPASQRPPSQQQPVVAAAATAVDRRRWVCVHDSISIVTAVQICAAGTHAPCQVVTELMDVPSHVTALTNVVHPDAVSCFVVSSFFTQSQQSITIVLTLLDAPDFTARVRCTLMGTCKSFCSVEMKSV